MSIMLNVGTSRLAGMSHNPWDVYKAMSDIHLLSEQLSLRHYFFCASCTQYSCCSHAVCFCFGLECPNQNRSALFTKVTCGARASSCSAFTELSTIIAIRQLHSGRLISEVVGEECSSRPQKPKHCKSWKLRSWKYEISSHCFTTGGLNRNPPTSPESATATIK